MGMARRLGATVEEAEDVAHDTLELVLRDPEWFDQDRGSLLTALGAVLRNRLIDRRRKAGTRQRAVPRLRLLQPDAGPAPLHERTAADARAQRQLFLSQLDPQERAVFQAWLRQRGQGWTGAEAAASLALSTAAYENAKKRLRRRCRVVLAELDLVPSQLFGPDGVSP
jgi:DNA-directed RNA polymerase specialized sigma24 family protein